VARMVVEMLASQSLLRQVRVLTHRVSLPKAWPAGSQSLLRQVRVLTDEYTLIAQYVGSQSLLRQVRVLTAGAGNLACSLVSIPSSSGPRSNPRRTGVSGHLLASQSLLRQVRVLTRSGRPKLIAAPSLNPFFVRSAF